MRPSISGVLLKVFLNSNRYLAGRHSLGQNIAEYSVGLAVVVLAIVAMTVYIKRGLSGRYATVVNAVTKKANSTQYEPYYENTTYDLDYGRKDTQVISRNGERSGTFNETYNISGNISYPLSQ